MQTEVIDASLIKAHGTGTAGIAHSRYKCVEIARQCDYENIMIIEDDCKFLVDKQEFEESINDFLQNAPSDWAGLWFGSFFQFYPSFEDNSINEFVRPITFNQDTGSLINKHYYDTYLKYCKECYEGYIRTGDDCYGTDQLLNKEGEFNLIKRDKIYVLKNRLCSQADDYSDRTFQRMCGGSNIQL